MTRIPKPLNLGTNAPQGVANPASENSGGRTPKPLQVSARPAEGTPAPSAPRTPQPIAVTSSAPPLNRTPRELSMSGTPQEREKGEKIEKMLHRSTEIDATMSDFKFRLKGRFGQLIGTNPDELINWGERNLTALREVTNEKVKFAKRLSDIDATGWIEKTQEAATKEKGFFDRFTRQEPPSFYTETLKGVRAKVAAMLPELTKLREEIFPDAEDLRMDIMALQVFVEWLDDNVNTMMAQNRVRVLVASQQTVLMVLAAIDNAKALCATHIQTIDELLTIAIPNWEIARSTR